MKIGTYKIKQYTFVFANVAKNLRGYRKINEKEFHDLNGVFMKTKDPTN